MKLDPTVIRHRKTALAALLSVCVAGLGWQILNHSDPAYQKRPLRYWLEQARAHDRLSRSSEAAVKAIGGRAVPALLDMLEVKDSAVRRELIELAGRYDWLKVRIHTRQEVVEMADYGFSVLGPAAKAAVPTLVRLLQDPDPETRCMAARCLSAIGPDARDAISPLLAYIASASLTRTNNEWNEKGMFCAVYALGRMGPEARPVLPRIRELTRDTNWLVRSGATAACIQLTGSGLEPVILALDPSNRTNWGEACSIVEFLGRDASNAIPALIDAANRGNWHIQEKAIETLGAIQSRPELCVAAIEPFLRSTNSFVRFHSLVALGQIGADNVSSAPLAEIVALLADPDDWVRRAATNTLLYLAPAIAIKAGVVPVP